MRLRLVSYLLAVAVLSSVLTGCSGAPPSNSANPDQNSATQASAAPFTNSGTTSEKSAEEPKEEKKGGFFSRAAEPAPVTIPAGTVIAVRLQQTVSSATANAGESFDAVLDEPLVVNGKTVAPRGAEVTGRVVEAKSSGRLHNSGYLRLALASITIGGRSVPVQTTTVYAKGANHNKRNAAMIGGGAGAGALIGGLAGGGKGALIGGLVGAGAGTGGAYATGKKDVTFSAERRLTFRLKQSFTTKG